MTPSSLSASEAALARDAQQMFPDQLFTVVASVAEEGKGDLRITAKTPSQLANHAETEKIKAKARSYLPGSKKAVEGLGLPASAATQTRAGPICSNCGQSRAKGAGHPKVCRVKRELASDGKGKDTSQAPNAAVSAQAAGSGSLQQESNALGGALNATVRYSFPPGVPPPASAPPSADLSSPLPMPVLEIGGTTPALVQPRFDALAQHPGSSAIPPQQLELVRRMWPCVLDSMHRAILCLPRATEGLTTYSPCRCRPIQTIAWRQNS